MPEPVSDAAFELISACVHSLHFSFGAALNYPYAPAKLAEENPPPVIYRRLQAASPPPSRQGAAWQTGMTLDGRPFDPAGPTSRLADVRRDPGAPSLGTPEPETVVADQWFSIPRKKHTIAFPGTDSGRYLLSVDYWNPLQQSGAPVTEEVDYHVTQRIKWARRPQHDWVAVSFEAFWPPERDSTDLLIPIGPCPQDCVPGRS
jgi:hypothetical protein